MKSQWKTWKNHEKPNPYHGPGGFCYHAPPAPILENLDHPSVLLTTWDSLKVLVFLLPIDLGGATGLPDAHIKDVVLNWFPKKTMSMASRDAYSKHRDGKHIHGQREQLKLLSQIGLAETSGLQACCKQTMKNKVKNKNGDA